jgi:hypothetical protein
MVESSARALVTGGFGPQGTESALAGVERQIEKPLKARAITERVVMNFFIIEVR